MSCRIRNIELDEGKKHYKEYEYALLYMISSELRLVRVEELGEVDWEECLEARFFSDEKELHIFEGEQGMCAVVTEDVDECDQNIRLYLLGKQYIRGKTKVIVKEYLLYDNDGQLLVEKTRLAGLR